MTWNGETFEIGDKCFVVTNRFGNDINFFAERLCYSSRAYVEALVKYYNQEECGTLMVACDKVLRG